MSGFDNGTIQGSVFAQTKQFGAVLRGFGPPVPQAGVVGDLYVDAQTFQLFEKRSTDAAADVDPWGHYIFVVPVTYQTRLKWFSSYAPSNSVGIDGDYCLLWGGYPNYGVQPMIYGPKAAGVWPANPVAVAVTINPLYTGEDQNEIGGGSSGTANQVTSGLSGSFWFDSVPAARIQALADRVLVGGAVVQNGARVPPVYTWVHGEANGFLTYFDTRSQVEVVQTIGGVGIASAIRTSDNPGNPATIANAPIAYAALAKNDVLDATAANRRSAWGYYGVALRAADGGAGAIAGSVQVAEFEIANMGAVMDINPYVGATSTAGVTYAQILGSGGEYAQSGLPVNAASAALHIAGVGAKFRKGINITSGAIDGTDGTTGTGVAISLAKGHEIDWYYSGGAGALGLTIRSDNTDVNNSTKIVSTNQGLRFYDQFEKTIFRVLPAQVLVGDNINYTIVSNIKSGTGNPYLQGTGADAAVGVDMVGQGQAQFNWLNQSRVRNIFRVADVGALSTNQVNFLQIAANDTLLDPVLSARGVDANVNVQILGKGTGGLVVKDGANNTKLQAGTVGLAFFGAALAAQPTITGSRGGNAALASLLTALATLGLIVDSTTV